MNINSSGDGFVFLGHQPAPLHNALLAHAGHSPLSSAGRHPGRRVASRPHPSGGDSAPVLPRLPLLTGRFSKDVPPAWPKTTCSHGDPPGQCSTGTPGRHEHTISGVLDEFPLKMFFLRDGVVYKGPKSSWLRRASPRRGAGGPNTSHPGPAQTRTCCSPVKGGGLGTDGFPPASHTRRGSPAYGGKYVPLLMKSHTPARGSPKGAGGDQGHHDVPWCPKARSGPFTPWDPPRWCQPSICSHVQAHTSAAGPRPGPLPTPPAHSTPAAPLRSSPSPPACPCLSHPLRPTFPAGPLGPAGAPSARTGAVASSTHQRRGCPSRWLCGHS